MQHIALRIAEFLIRAPHVRVVTHIDADGITSGAIASLALRRAGIPHEVEFIKQLDDQVVEELRIHEGILWFTDLGSAKLHRFDPARTVVTDHHTPQNGDPEPVALATRTSASVSEPSPAPVTLSRCAHALPSSPPCCSRSP